MSSINPIGYPGTTTNGNPYKKSNTAKTAVLTTFAAIDVSPYIFKNNKIAKMFTMEECIKSLSEVFKIKISPKMTKPIAIIGFALDLVFGYAIGQSIDNWINNKRAAKADAIAETKKAAGTNTENQ